MVSATYPEPQPRPDPQPDALFPTPDRGVRMLLPLIPNEVSVDA